MDGERLLAGGTTRFTTTLWGARWGRCWCIGLGFGRRLGLGFARFGLGLTAIAAGCGDTGGITLSAIGDVPTRAFEDDAYGLEDPPDGAFLTARTNAERCVLEGLHLLKLLATRIAGIDIGGHGG